MHLSSSAACAEDHNDVELMQRWKHQLTVQKLLVEESVIHQQLDWVFYFFSCHEVENEEVTLYQQSCR